MSHYPFLHLWSENQVRSVCLRTISMGESTAHVLLEEGFGWQHFILLHHVTLNRRGFWRRFNHLNFIYLIISLIEVLSDCLLWIFIQLRNSEDLSIWFLLEIIWIISGTLWTWSSLCPRYRMRTYKVYLMTVISLQHIAAVLFVHLREMICLLLLAQRGTSSSSKDIFG